MRSTAEAVTGFGQVYLLRRRSLAIGILVFSESLLELQTFTLIFIVAKSIWSKVRAGCIQE
ncbi:hypothetical protein [Pontibacter chitinilyticus]|uniref:hypothetical protein n=1 Tax=Pontibacter chitinilyticus TaxID=2674989 RepID=UPI00321BDD60